MNFKWLWFLAAVLILGFCSLAESSCNVSPRQRRDCGYPGISRKTCLNRGCCFSGRIRNAKWCFYRMYEFNKGAF
uniref:P-type domain-containing protein n=1 Tax=Salvator merianae TaxID=96440 RepID=A0A8D0KNY4_SALMN